MPQVWVVVDHFTLYADLFQLILMSKQNFKNNKIKQQTSVKLGLEFRWSINATVLNDLKFAFLTWFLKEKKTFRLNPIFCSIELFKCLNLSSICADWTCFKSFFYLCRLN